MTFLHAHSCKCLKSELLLFDVPLTQTMIEDSHWVQYKPISSLAGESPIEFVVPSSGLEYLDLAHTILSLKVGIKSTVAEADMSADAKKLVGNVGFVNNTMHSLFSQIDCSLNQTPVSPPNNSYPYRAYIETLLNYGPAAKNSHLSSVLWFSDTANKMDDTDLENEGLVARREIMTKKKTIDLIGHIHGDIFNQDRLLLNGVEMRIRLIRSKDSFCLMDPAGIHSVQVLDANLLVRRVKISPGVLLAHAKALSKSTAKYPLTRVEVKVLTLTSGTNGQTLDNIILGQLPKRIIIGFVENKAYNGNRFLNPFNFKNLNINFLCLYVDGNQIPSKALLPDFKGKMYVDCYHSLFSGCGIHFLNDGNAISRTDYPNGYCLFAFDLTPNISANKMTDWNLIKHGSVRLDVRFASALTSTISVIVYALVRDRPRNQCVTAGHC